MSNEKLPNETMRPIKFKAKREDNNEWVYGSYISDWVKPNVFVIACVDGQLYHIDSETLCQFTGMYDKDGKEIWEGDVLQGVSNNPFSKGLINEYEIVWGVDHWHVKGTHFTLQELFDYCANNITVIDNIHNKGVER